MAGIRGRIDLVTHTLKEIDRRLSVLENAVIAMNQTTIEIAKQQVRLDTHAQRLEDLESFIHPRPNA